MNEIEIKIDFTKGTLATKGIALITGDYASTMLKFTFDREDGTKVFEMKNPSDELVYVGEIINGEVLLTSKVDATTIHNNKTYTKYTKNDAIYWYQPTDNKLFTDEWVEVATFNLEEYTKVQVNASLFSESGKYIFEVSLYKDDTKLTSTKGILPVKQEQVIVGDEIVEAYIPIFDELIQTLNEKITETNNLDIDVDNTGGVTTVTLTKKDGTTKEVEVMDTNDYYTKSETYSDDEVDTLFESYTKTSDLANVALSGAYSDLSGTPTKLSDFTNDPGYIDKDVNNLTNYTTTSNMNTSISNAVGIETTNRQNSDVALQNQIDAITSASDVVDVVSTYQDLLDYDTSKLTDKDVIKVMQDSTHSNAISYYRWVSNAWSYVGSEGPFYTKGETDTLLNAKQNTISSTNKVNADYVDDTSSTNKFTNATEKAYWNAKVGTTDYASANNYGVIKGANDTAFYLYNGSPYAGSLSLALYNSAGGGTFIGKATLENVITGKELTNKTYVDSANEEQDTLIEELKQENELLLDQIPKGTATGQDITLNDSSNLPIKSIEISGNTSQDTTTGKNLLKNTATTRTISGLTFTKNEDGTMLVNGTASENVNFDIGTIDNLTLGNTYHLCGCPSGGSSSIY